MNNSTEVQKDKFTFAYTLWTALVFLMLVYGKELSPLFRLWGVFGFVILGLIAILLIYLVGNFVRNIWAKRWQKVLSIIVAPFIAGGFFLALFKMDITPDWIRFEWNKSYYLEEISKLPKTSGESRFKVFNWGETGGVAVVNSFYTLIYDESDEIGLPESKRSQEWNERIDRIKQGSELYSIREGESPIHQIETKKIEGHFYLVTETME